MGNAWLLPTALLYVILTWDWWYLAARHIRAIRYLTMSVSSLAVLVAAGYLVARGLSAAVLIIPVIELLALRRAQVRIVGPPNSATVTALQALQPHAWVIAAVAIALPLLAVINLLIQYAAASAASVAVGAILAYAIHLVLERLHHLSAPGWGLAPEMIMGAIGGLYGGVLSLLAANSLNWPLTLGCALAAAAFVLLLVQLSRNWFDSEFFTR